MGRPAINLTGIRIHKIIILKRAPNRGHGSVPYWQYRCSCGKVKDARADVLVRGKQHSCGCERTKNKFTDMTGKRFGKLIALWPAGRGGKSKSGCVYWLCSCDCGGMVTTAGKSLRLGLTKSCGCWKPQKTHGLSKTSEFFVLKGIQSRARKIGIPFNLTIEDVEAPSFCPILGIPLIRNKGKRYASPNSPTVDRFIPSIGYVKGNVQVISHRANQIKSDASLEELKKIVTWMEAINEVQGTGVASQR